VVKPRRMRWAGLVVRMGRREMCREFWWGNLTKFSLERPKLRWDEKLTVDVAETIGGRAVVSTVTNI